MPPDRLPEGEKASPSRQPPVAEREPLTIVVIDAPPAEQVVIAPPTAPARVRTRTDIEVPAAAPRRRWPFLLLIGFAAVLLFSTYRNVFKPVALRFMHGIERRVVGDRSYDLPRPPKSKWPQS